MAYPNRISATISEESLQEIMQAIDRIDKLLPDLVTLSNEKMTSLPKVSFSTIEFVYETLELVDRYPELIPQDIEIPEIRRDAELIESINKILKPLKKLVRRLEDSAVLAGSEAYLPSIAIYNAVKTGDKNVHQ